MIRIQALRNCLCRSQPSQAMDLLSKVLETSPSPAMWYLLGRIHQKANQHLDAVKAFQAALKSLKSTAFSCEDTPSFRSDCFHGYGVSLFELRETSQALTLFNKAIKANRRNSKVSYVCVCIVSERYASWCVTCTSFANC